MIYEKKWQKVSRESRCSKKVMLPTQNFSMPILSDSSCPMKVMIMVFLFASSRGIKKTILMAAVFICFEKFLFCGVYEFIAYLEMKFYIVETSSFLLSFCLREFLVLGVILFWKKKLNRQCFWKKCYFKGNLRHLPLTATIPQVSPWIVCNICDLRQPYFIRY